jgi:Domain of unknown function (DUF4276)
MTRILLNVEGETEESFVNNVIAPHLYNNGFHTVGARLIGNSRARSRRGGIRSWQETKKDIVRQLCQDQQLVVGLMVDYYALPDNWPNRTEAEALSHLNKGDSIQKALRSEVENEMGQGFISSRFVPLVMMHEFESMLFSDCEKFAAVVGLPIAESLILILQEFEDPEKINDSPITAPSKRVLKLVPGYEKPLYGNLIAMEIGLDKIRMKCQHFNKWLSELENTGPQR